jgi:hypothetical protein
VKLGVGARSAPAIDCPSGSKVPVNVTVVAPSTKEPAVCAVKTSLVPTGPVVGEYAISPSPGGGVPGAS